jgi:NACHT domain
VWETVAAKAATTVARTVAQALVAKRPGAGLVARPARPGLQGRTPARLGETEVGRLAGTLARRLAAACADGAYGTLPAYERQAALDAVRDTFAGAGELGARELFAADLDADALLARLREHRPPAALSDAGEALYADLLRLCCLHVVEFTTTLPGFGARADVELVRRSGEAARSLADIRERLGPASGALAFEERYADYVAEAHSRIELFGLTTRTRSEWPLETAYISLGVSAERAVPGFGLPRTAPAVVKVEQAFADADRTLLRGPAGSGKSTLVQWLAVNAARRTFDGPLADLNRCVPFVLRLRSLAARAADALPLPADFLAAAGVPLHGSEPAGWAERLLTEGRALVLVDGVDEVPEPLRRRTHAWLRSLTTAFPKARYVVTTRPSAVPEDWLARQGFTAHALLPMERHDVAAFVAHWHAAARAECADPAEAELLDRYERSLAETVSTRRDLARLATNPLMCALLCALHRDRRTHLPRARKELYDAALDMLLVRRDTEREVSGVEGVYLTREEQTLLLQRLAYWLIRNGQAETSRGEALEMLTDWLKAMPQLSGDPERIFRHLLNRTGLLREPAPDTVDFVHRTFQDYLGARAAVAAKDFGLLVARAHDDQWDDVVRMAVGHARPDERARLLRGLLRRADRAKRYRHRLVLLAAACLDHTPELDPAVREEIERRTSELLPPASYEEAEELARVGPLVLELLPGPEGLDEECAAATVRTAALVGGDAGLAVIRRAREDGRQMVGTALGDAWSQFPAQEYADAVLKHASLERIMLSVRTHEQARILPQLPYITNYHIESGFDLIRDVDLVRDATRMTFTHSVGLTDLAPLRALRKLTFLCLKDQLGVTDLSPLAQTPITELYLYGLPTGADLTPLEGMPKLTDLVLDFPAPGGTLEALPLPEHATGLGLLHAAAGTDLAGIDRWPGLTWLLLTGQRQYAQIQSVRALPLLKVLQLHHLEQPELRQLVPLRDLAQLWFSECPSLNRIGVLALLPSLKTIALTDCGTDRPVDLAPLAEADHLTIRVFGDTSVVGTEHFPPQRLITLPRRRRPS